jgi:hypothetical protein
MRRETVMTKLTIDEVLGFFRAGWMTSDEAVSELLKSDPVRFQRQAHQAHQARSFLALNV